MHSKSTDPPPSGTFPHRQDLNPKRQKQPRMIDESFTGGLVVVICRELLGGETAGAGWAAGTGVWEVGRQNS